MAYELFPITGYNFPSYAAGSYGSRESFDSLQALKATGANTLSIVPTLYLSTRTSADFHPTQNSESDAAVRAQMVEAKRAGFQVIVKPHVDSMDGTPPRDLFAPADIDAWFAGYKALLLRYAAMAQETGADMVCIGTELDSLVGAEYRDRWIDIIDAVRAVFHGPLTYANVSGGVEKVSFWDRLDVIGIDGYYQLSRSTNPTPEALHDAWVEPPLGLSSYYTTGGRAPIEYLHDISVTYGKPIYFAEVGYRSVDGAATQPGNWRLAGATDTQEQVDLYRALLEVWSSYGGDWFLGMQMWDWRPRLDPLETTDFNPQRKPALGVVTAWFSGQETPAGRAVAGTAIGNVLDGGQGADTIDGGMGSDLLRGSDGADLLAGGPDTPTVPGALRIEVAARGNVYEGVGSRFSILVNDVAIGDVFEVGATPATFAVTHDGAAPAVSLGVRFLNDRLVPGVFDRNLILGGIWLNGNPLPQADAVNPYGDGWQIWSNGTLRYDLSGRQNWLTGDASDDDTLDGGAGDDTLAGAMGADSLLGGEGDDSLSGGEGGDTAEGGLGADTLDGGAGNDLLIGGPAALPAASHAVIAVTARGEVYNRVGARFAMLVNGAQVGAAMEATGTAQTFSLRYDAAEVPVSLGIRFFNDYYVAGSADRNLYVSAITVNGNALVQAEAQGDEGNGRWTLLRNGSFTHDLRGREGWFTLDATDDDSLSGGAGDDTLSGGAGGDRLAGGTGADRLSGDDGADTLLGEDGADMLAGGEGDDSLSGGTGRDRLAGGPGRDTLNGGAQADTMDGGLGDDTYLVTPGDVLIDAGGRDTVLAGLNWTLAEGLEALTLTGGANIAGTGNDSANAILGNGGRNLLAGLAGDDSLSGGRGDDTLVGGPGADTLAGGPGADVFRYLGPGEGGDLILDYSSAADWIEVSSAGFGLGLAPGSAPGARYAQNAGGKATAPAGTGQFVFDTAARVLWWDPDGAGEAAAVVIVALPTARGFGAGEILVIA